MAPPLPLSFNVKERKKGRCEVGRELSPSLCFCPLSFLSPLSLSCAREIVKNRQGIRFVFRTKETETGFTLSLQKEFFFLCCRHPDRDLFSLDLSFVFFFLSTTKQLYPFRHSSASSLSSTSSAPLAATFALVSALIASPLTISHSPSPAHRTGKEKTTPSGASL